MDDARSKRPSEPIRKRYEPPTIEQSGDFERLVLACGHTPEEAAAGNEMCDGTFTNS
jgi:hypothetical protein